MIIRKRVNVYQMNYINELIYTNQVAQTKKLAKDKKQKNKYRQIALMNEYSSADVSADDSAEVEAANELASPIKAVSEEDERRLGNDRRKEQQERGRYIESRQKKNRRYQRELFLKI